MYQNNSLIREVKYGWRIRKKIIDMRNLYFSISYGESGSDVYVGDKVHFSWYALD